MKYIFLIFSFIVSISTLFSQETKEFNYSNSLYQKGTSLYEEGLYLNAKKVLEEFIEELNISTIHPKSKLMYAELMIAKAAIYSKSDDGELLLSNFVKKYAPEKITQEALFELAEYYFNAKIFQQAISNYNKIDTLHLNNEEKSALFFKRGYAYFTRNDDINASVNFNKINSSENIYSKKANYYSGILSFKKGEYEKSLNYFEKSKGESKFDQVVPYYQSQIYFALGDYTNVTRVGKTALQSNKKIEYTTELNQLVGKAFFEQNNYSLALPYLEKFETDAEEVRAQDLYQVAYTRYKTGNYDKAIQTFEELKNVKSELGQNSLFILANSYLKKGDKNSAKNAFAGAAKLPYDDEIKKESNYQYGKLSYDLGFDREAIAAFKNIPSTSKNYNESQQILSKIFLSTKDYDKAMEVMGNMPNKTPSISEAYQKVSFLKGIELFNDNNYEDSKKYLNQSIENSVNDNLKAQAVYQLGEMAHIEKDYEESASKFLQYNALAKTNPNLPQESSVYMSDYILGYNYLKLKNYQFAGIHFDNAVNGMIDNWGNITSKDIKERIFPDAILRTGDSHFNKNDYKKALKYYQTSIEYKYSGNDYALFQKARILGVQGHKIDQIVALETLINENPNSTYADDALYLLGKTYFSEGNYDKAEVAVYDLVTKYSDKSNLINKGYLLLGLINYNQNESDNALKYYEAASTNNPSEGELNTALQSIQEIYVDQNNPEGFIDFKERILGQKVSDDTKENLVFKAGELQYEASNYPNAINGYTKYINKYPTGKYILQAHFNRAECNLIQNKYNEALPDYEFVISKGNSNWYEKSLKKASNISYNYIENFEKSYNYFAALTKVASDSDTKLNADLGALRSAYRIGLTDGIYSSADLVLQNNEATEAQKSTAHFFKAKTAMQLDDYNIALEHFRESARESNVQGAESRYQISYIYYLQQELNIARKLCMSHLKTSKNYERWVAKGLLLLSDISFEQGDLFNARAALETLIENYKSENNPEIISEAKEKLSLISELESVESRIIPE